MKTSYKHTLRNLAAALLPALMLAACSDKDLGGSYEVAEDPEELTAEALDASTNVCVRLGAPTFDVTTRSAADSLACAVEFDTPPEPPVRDKIAIGKDTIFLAVTSEEIEGEPVADAYRAASEMAAAGLDEVYGSDRQTRGQYVSDGHLPQCNILASYTKEGNVINLINITDHFDAQGARVRNLLAFNTQAVSGGTNVPSWDAPVKILDGNGKEVKWPGGNDQYVDFVAWALGATAKTASENRWNYVNYWNQGCGLTPAADNNSSASFEFDYNTREVSGNWQDGEMEHDLVIAMAHHKSVRNDANASVVPLEFYHALTAIEFRIQRKDGNYSSDKTTVSNLNVPYEINLKSVAIETVYHSGHCKVTSVGNKPTFEWTNLGTPCGTWQKLSSGNQGDGAEGGTATDLGNATGLFSQVENGNNSQNYTFFQIPQELDLNGHTSYVIFDYEIAGQRRQIKHPLKKIVPDGKFKPGQKIIINIGFSDKVGIDIPEGPDNVGWNYKRNIKIQNTGSAPGYIRAMVVGSWRNSSGYVVQNWTIDNLPNPGEHWAKGSDGFYYYTEIVHPGLSTNNLINEYTADRTGNENNRLDLDIIAQIVRWNGVKTYWTNIPFTPTYQE